MPATHPQDATVAEVAVVAAGIAASVGAIVTCSVPSLSIPAAIATPFVVAFSALTCGVAAHVRRRRGEVNKTQDLDIDGLYEELSELPSPDIGPVPGFELMDPVRAAAPYMTVPAETLHS